MKELSKKAAEKNEERKLPPFEDEMTTHIEKLKDCTKEDILGKSYFSQVSGKKNSTEKYNTGLYTNTANRNAHNTIYNYPKVNKILRYTLDKTCPGSVC